MNKPLRLKDDEINFQSGEYITKIFGMQYSKLHCYEYAV